MDVGWTGLTRTFWFCLLAQSSNLFFGYQVGIYNSFFQVYAERVLGIFDEETQMSAKGTLSTLFLVGGTVASMTGNVLYQNLGLVRGLLATMAGNALICLLYLVPSLWVNYVARFICGYLCCFFGLVPAMLIKKYLHESVGNILLRSYYLYITAGIFIAYFICVPENVDHWRWALGCPLLFLVPLMLILYFFFPENSLRVWSAAPVGPVVVVPLVDRPSKVLTPSDPSFPDSNETLSDTPEREVTLQECFGPAYRTQVALAVLLNLGNQLTGINILVYYSTDIYTKVGLPNPTFLTMLNGVFGFIGAVILTFFVGRFYKRDVIMAGIAAQAVLMFTVVLGIVSGIGFLVALGSFGFILSFSISLGGMINPYAVDFVPPAAFPLTTAPSWVLACLVTKFALPLLESIGEVRCFLICSSIALGIGLLFLKYSVVTEGKTPQQIRAEFISKRLF